MSNRKKLDPPGRHAPQHRQDHGRHREPPTPLSGFTTRPGHAGVKILAAGVLGSAAVMAVPVGAAAAALADGRAGAPAPASATLTAALVSPQAALGLQNGGVGSQNGADLALGSVLSRAFDQPIASSAPAGQASAASLLQGLLNSQPVGLPSLGGDLTPSASGASESIFPFNVASLGDVVFPASAFGTGSNSNAVGAGLQNLQVNPLANLAQGGNQVQLAQLVPDQNSGTILGTDIPVNQTIPPGGFIPSANGITVTGPGVSVLTDSNGNAQVTISAGMGPNGPEPATTFTLPPNGEIHLGSGVLNVPRNASSVNLPPGVYTVGDPPPAGQPDQRSKIIVDSPQPPASPSQTGPSGGGASNDQNQPGSDAAAQAQAGGTGMASSDSGTVQTAGLDGAGPTTSTVNTDIMAAGDPTAFDTPSA